MAIEAKGHRPSSTKLPKPGDAPVNSWATFPALPVTMEQRYHDVARDTGLLDVPTVALPRVSYSVIEASNPVMPRVCIRVEDALRHVDEKVVGTKLDDAVNVSSVKTLIDSADDLRVFPRHRLRLKPGGFEGVLRVAEASEAHDLALAQSRDPCRRRVDADAAFPAASEGASKFQDFSVEFPELLGRDPELCPSGVYVGPKCLIPSRPR
jgi:hypothetical protein